MTLQTLKTVLLVSAILISISMFMAFIAAPYLGSAYLMMLKPVGGSDFPRLTSDFALPMLRADLGDALSGPDTAIWVSLVWGILIVTPLLLMGWSFMTATVEDCLARWFSGLMLYYSAVMCLFVAIISGLIISVSHMG